MLLRWLRNRRRLARLREPFPPAWNAILHDNVRQYHRLKPDEQRRVRDYVQIFVGDKHWEGCGGQTITDEVRVTIAGQVGVLVLGMPGEYFDRVLSILVYPDTYRAHATVGSAGGIVIEGDSARSGEAWYRGPVILSWPDVLAGGRHHNHGRNVVFHEFAHQLDMLNDGRADGVPVIESAGQASRWLKAAAGHYQQLVHDCEHGHPTLLDCYGTTNMAEFFAVATETFFERSAAMQKTHPELYRCLADFYRQEPALRG